MFLSHSSEIAIRHDKVGTCGYKDQGHSRRTKEGEAHLGRAFKFYTDSERKPTI